MVIAVSWRPFGPVSALTSASINAAITCKPATMSHYRSARGARRHESPKSTRAVLISYENTRTSISCSKHPTPGLGLLPTRRRSTRCGTEPVPVGLGRYTEPADEHPAERLGTAEAGQLRTLSNAVARVERGSADVHPHHLHVPSRRGPRVGLKYPSELPGAQRRVGCQRPDAVVGRRGRPLSRR